MYSTYGCIQFNVYPSMIYIYICILSVKQNEHLWMALFVLTSWRSCSGVIGPPPFQSDVPLIFHETIQLSGATSHNKKRITWIAVRIFFFYFDAPRFSLNQNRTKIVLSMARWQGLSSGVPQHCLVGRISPEFWHGPFFGEHTQSIHFGDSDHPHKIQF